MRKWQAAVAAVAVASLAACSGSSKPTASQSPTPSPSERLAALAAAGRAASYTGTYSLTQGTKGVGKAVVAVLPPHYWLVITVGRVTTEFLFNNHGYYSCGKKTRWECLAVARPGQAVPKALDPGIENVFTNYLTILAARASEYQVTTAAVAVEINPSSKSCFVVRARSNTPKPVVADGTYCFTERGIPTLAQYRGNRLSLQQLTAAPAAKTLTPPARPTPLPR